jgi:hypothetical protein
MSVCGPADTVLMTAKVSWKGKRIAALRIFNKLVKSLILSLCCTYASFRAIDVAARCTSVIEITASDISEVEFVVFVFVTLFADSLSEIFSVSAVNAEESAVVVKEIFT